MTNALPPALTPETWAARWLMSKDGHVTAGLGELNNGLVLATTSDAGWLLESSDRHALAALCLYEQPFGFSREDVELCRRFVRGIEFANDVEDADSPDERIYPDNIDLRARDHARLVSLADRITALLPPA